jgi:hypothetical protein
LTQQGCGDKLAIGWSSIGFSAKILTVNALHRVLDEIDSNIHAPANVGFDHWMFR